MMRSARGILRFWMKELWGPDWDWERRRLLVKHYWASFRNGSIPTTYLPEPATAEPRGPIAVAQQRFSAEYRRRIEIVQDRPPWRRGVHLTYRPLGKNLRLLATALREHVDRNRRLHIETEGPATEQKALASRGFQWSPWLWIRSRQDSAPGLRDAARAWNELFRHPPPREKMSEPPPRVGGLPHPRLKHPEVGASWNQRRLERLLALAAATRYVFTPVVPIMERLQALRIEMGWPEHRPVLGIHVRRGDAASTEDSPERSTRRSFGLESYLETADRLCSRYGIRDIFLATESGEEIERAVRLRPDYRFLWLNYDRSIYPAIGTSAQFIEDYALAHPELARDLATGAILDLYFFCECNAFVGAFNSEFSVLAWLLVIGSRGCLVPYVSLSQPGTKLSLHPFAALLNLKTNCPLELYHW